MPGLNLVYTSLCIDCPVKKIIQNYKAVVQASDSMTASM